jgi:hypothetical protein
MVHGLLTLKVTNKIVRGRPGFDSPCSNGVFGDCFFLFLSFCNYQPAGISTLSTLRTGNISINGMPGSPVRSLRASQHLAHWCLSRIKTSEKIGILIKFVGVSGIGHGVRYRASQHTVDRKENVGGRSGFDSPCPNGWLFRESSFFFCNARLAEISHL